jgi:Mg2+ and Co2+ transporter CorA
METKTINRSIDIVKMEINKIHAIIQKRNEWLAQPENKMRSTYRVVLKDTQELVEYLKELEKELQQLINH